MTKTVIVHHANQLVTVDAKWISAENPLGIVLDGAMVIQDDCIHWIGPSSKLGAEFNSGQYPDVQWIDASGQIVLPGLIDSHTHAIFSGDRSHEFEMRLQGKTYLDIAQAGGGILNTVTATRKASAQELSDLTQARLARMMQLGVTTAEVKSGYGLDFDTELKCLRVLRDLQALLPIQICPTYMGAHDIPPEYKDNIEGYVDVICHEQIPPIAQEGLAVFCDVFCEVGYFSVEQSRRVLETAKVHGMKLKIHAEEFNDIGGAALAGELGASSADHLLHISEAGIAALKVGGTVATLLPGTAFYLRVPYAPARKILDAGVLVAIATDFNPGSCNTENLQLMMTLACLQMRMTPAEVIQSVTINAAKALDLDHDRGSLTVGKRADWVVFDVPNYQELLYHYGINFVRQVGIAGQVVVSH